MANGNIEGTNRIQAVIVDRDETALAQISTCLGLEYAPMLNDAGAWSARFPATDPRLSLIQLKAHFLDFYVDGELFLWGLTEAQTWELDESGQQILVISGRDPLAELDESTLNFVSVEDEADAIDNAPLTVLISYNTNQSLDHQFTLQGETATETGVYAHFAGETALSALRRIAEEIGESFRLGSVRRSVEWLGTATPASGVRAVGAVGEPTDAEDNQFICFIQNLTEYRNASRMITKIIPYGSGLGETRLDLVGTSRSVPSPFLYSAVDNYIANQDALAYIGKGIERHVNFKNIRPLFNTDADMLSAKNYLFDAAFAYLKRNDDINDTLEYNLDVIALPSHVKSGMSLRVVWQDDLRNIDTDLTILSIPKRVGSNGEITYALKVATGNQWRFRETNNVVAQVEEGEIFAAHPQIDATSYWMPFREVVGDNQTDHMAEMPFWLSAEIVTIRQVLFRFKVEQALAIVKSYDYAAPTVENNASSNTGDTSVTIDATTATVQDATATVQDATVNVQTTAVVVGTGGTSTIIGAATPDATTGTNDGDVGESTSIPSGWIDPANHIHLVTEHTHNFAHGHAVDAEHAHSSDAHDHAVDAHGHTGNAHGHTGNSHSHTNSAHHHAETQHVHNLPDLESTTSAELVDASLTYAIGGLEYSVNGGSWALLSTGIPVAGGYSEIDITSLVQNPNGLKRPYQEFNLVQVRRTTGAGTGKSAQLRAQIGIRATVQSIVLYE